MDQATACKLAAELAGRDKHEQSISSDFDGAGSVVHDLADETQNSRQSNAGEVLVPAAELTRLREIEDVIKRAFKIPQVSPGQLEPLLKHILLIVDEYAETARLAAAQETRLSTVESEVSALRDVMTSASEKEATSLPAQELSSSAPALRVEELPDETAAKQRLRLNRRPEQNAEKKAVRAQPPAEVGAELGETMLRLKLALQQQLKANAALEKRVLEMRLKGAHQTKLVGALEKALVRSTSQLAREQHM